MMEPDARDATTKGAILRSLLKFVENDLTSEQWREVKLTMPADDRPLLDVRSVLASQKVSEFVLNRLTAVAAEVKGESLDSFGRRAGKAELSDAVGIYRILTMVLTPTALLKKASTLWATVHSHGKLTVDKDLPGEAVVSLRDYPSEAAHCARLTGWFEGAGDMTKAKDAKVVHDLCMTRGDERCRWQLSWR